MTRNRITLWLDPDDADDYTIVWLETARQAEQLVQVLKQHNSLAQSDKTVKPVKWAWDQLNPRAQTTVEVERG